MIQCQDFKLHSQSHFTVSHLATVTYLETEISDNKPGLLLALPHALWLLLHLHHCWFLGTFDFFLSCANIQAQLSAEKAKRSTGDKSSNWNKADTKHGTYLWGSFPASFRKVFSSPQPLISFARRSPLLLWELAGRLLPWNKWRSLCHGISLSLSGRRDAINRPHIQDKRSLTVSSFSFLIFYCTCFGGKEYKYHQEVLLKSRTL